MRQGRAGSQPNPANQMSCRTDWLEIARATPAGSCTSALTVTYVAALRRRLSVVCQALTGCTRRVRALPVRWRTMPVTQAVRDNLRDRLVRWRMCLHPSRRTALILLAGVAVGMTAPTAAALAERAAAAGVVSLRPAGSTRTATITKLKVSAASAAGGLVRLSAMERAANGTHPAGWVQFEADNTDIGAPVAVSPAGEATTTAAFLGAAPIALMAAFTPANTGYLASAAADGALSAASDPEAGTVDLTVSVPLAGSFVVTVTPGTVTLQKPTKLGVATGVLQQVTLSETRNWYPGWSVSGQVSDVIAKGHSTRQTISGTQLGWAPTGMLTDGAILGPAIAPNSPGLGATGGVLASAATGSGVGTETLSAALTLVMPASAASGPYRGLLTITYVESAVQASASSPSLVPSVG